MKYIKLFACFYIVFFSAILPAAENINEASEFFWVQVR